MYCGILKQSNIMKTNLIRLFVIFFFVFGMSMSGLMAQHKTEFIFTDTAPKDVIANMQESMTSVFEVIHNSYENDLGTLNFDNSYITDSAAVNLKAKWSVSHFYCSVAGAFIQRVIKGVYGYEVRNVPVYMVAADDKYQEMVFEFDDAGRITDAYVPIDYVQYNKIMLSSTDVKDFSQREIVMRLVNRFRDAYNNKDSIFLDKIFSDDALIITGKVIDRKDNNAVDVSYVSQNKEGYMKNLKKVFNKNRYINVEFDDIKVTRHAEYDYLYGVNLVQHWSASGGYQDDGYLFLLFDFRDEDQPVIWVRTWQAMKDAENKDIHYEPHQIYSLDDVNWVGEE